MAAAFSVSRFDGSGPYPQPKRPIEHRLQLQDPPQSISNRPRQQAYARTAADGYNAYNGNPFIEDGDYDNGYDNYGQPTYHRRLPNRIPMNRGPRQYDERDHHQRAPRDGRWDQDESIPPQNRGPRPLAADARRGRPDHMPRYHQDMQRKMQPQPRQNRPPPGRPDQSMHERPARTMPPNHGGYQYDQQRRQPLQCVEPPNVQGEWAQSHHVDSSGNQGDIRSRGVGPSGSDGINGRRAQLNAPAVRSSPSSRHGQRSEPPPGPGRLMDQQNSREPFNDPMSPKMMAWDNPFPVFPSKKSEKPGSSGAENRDAPQRQVDGPISDNTAMPVVSYVETRQKDYPHHPQRGLDRPALPSVDDIRHTDNTEYIEHVPTPGDAQQQLRSRQDSFPRQSEPLLSGGDRQVPRSRVHDSSTEINYFTQKLHENSAPRHHGVVNTLNQSRPDPMAVLSAPFSADDEFKPNDSLSALNDSSIYDEDSLTSNPRTNEHLGTRIDGVADDDRNVIHEMMGDLPPAIPVRHHDHTLGRASPSSGPIELPGENSQPAKEPVQKSIVFQLPSSTPSGRAINSDGRSGRNSPDKGLLVQPAGLFSVPEEIRLPQAIHVDRRFPSPQGRFNHERPVWNDSLVVKSTQLSPALPGAAFPPRDPSLKFPMPDPGANQQYTHQQSPDGTRDTRLTALPSTQNAAYLPAVLQPGLPRPFGNNIPASSHRQRQEQQQQQLSQPQYGSTSAGNMPQSEVPQLTGPVPIRQHDNETMMRKSRTHSQAASDRKPLKETAVTHEELDHLRRTISAHSSDSATQLKLAKRLVEAASVLAVGADIKAKNRDRDRYVLEAHSIVKRLVANGYTDAMFYLADCYGQGLLGLQPDPREAFNLYLAAAKAGHSAAAYRTAVCCEIGPDEGGGTRKDAQKALQWYRHAAMLENVPAMYKLGMILLKGLLGQPKNAAEAVSWLNAAAQRADAENPHALHELGLLYEDPAAHAGGGGPDVVVRDEARALELFRQSAALGYKYSQFRIGQAHEYGMLGCTVDPRRSIVWYTKAAAQGEHQSELALSGWYLTGSEGILEHSDVEAYLWAKKAASSEPPLPKAMFAMGYFAESGIGCPRNVEEAKRWYGRAAAYKFPKAQERLEELKKGGPKLQKGKENREKLSRKDAKESDCVVM